MPKITVVTRLIKPSSHLSSIIAIWAQVMVAPLDSKIVVLRRGTSNGLMALMPVGGQILPTSIFGLKEEWKKAQKKARKKNTSEEIKRTIPIRIPSSTLFVWAPRWVASRVTSRHHIIIVKIIKASPICIRSESNLCIHDASPPTRHRLPKDPVRGQGLASTKWNGWCMINSDSLIFRWSLVWSFIHLIHFTL